MKVVEKNMDNYIYRIKYISLYVTPPFSRNPPQFLLEGEKGDRRERFLFICFVLNITIHGLFKKY